MLAQGEAYRIISTSTQLTMSDCDPERIVEFVFFAKRPSVLFVQPEVVAQFVDDRQADLLLSSVLSAQNL